MPRPRALAAVSLLISLSCVVAGRAQQAEPPAPASDLRPALSAQIAYLGLDGATLAEIAPRTPFTVDVTLINEAGQDAPRGVELFGWLRRHSDRNLPCLQAARGYFGTGRLSLDAVPLLGPVVGVVAQDGSFTVVDPFLDLASANLIGAATLDERPAALVADPAGGGFLISLPEAGEVRRLTAYGAAQTIVAQGLAEPTTLIAADDGGAWVLEAGAHRVSHLSASGAVAQSLPGAAALSGDALTVLVRDEDGAVSVLPASGGAVLATLPPIPGIRAELPIHDAEDGLLAVARLGAAGLSLTYLDAPGNAYHIPLAAPASRLVADPQGRVVMAWDPSGGPVSIIDLARGRMVQAVTVGGDDSGAAVADVLMTDNAAFLMLADQSTVGAISLTALGKDGPAPIRRIQLGDASDRVDHGAGMLVALAPRSEVMAIHADRYTGFLLHESSTMGDAPPMASVRLRGGVPWAASVLDRGFRQIAPGRLRAAAMLPGEGSFELVLSTGLGGMTLCFPVPTLPDSQPPDGPARMSARIGAAGTGGMHDVTLIFTDVDGQPLPPPRGTLSLAALETGWTRRVVLATDTQPVIALPPLGAYVATISGGDGAEFPPLVFEVTR